MTTNVVCEGRVASNPDELATVVIGQRYRITDGAMKGLEGVVRQRIRHERILLGVNIFGQDTLLEISPDRLEPAGQDNEDCLATNFEMTTETAEV